MIALLCELILSCLVATPGAKSIDELTYGTALYAYHQEEHGQALLTVMVAEAQGRRGDDRIRFDLAKGSFAFKSRMYGLASQTFEAVADEALTPIDRARLAFHLARERYRSEDWQGLAQALTRIDPGAHGRSNRYRHPEVAFMTAEMAIARGDLDVARAALEPLEPGDPHLAYGLFNLGVASRAAGDLPGARQALAHLADLPAADPETLEIVQRGRLALAIMDRQAGQAVDAEAVLRRLPGAGRYRDLALATYAGLAMDNGEYELAARIWLTLDRESGWSVSSAAAQLGYPMSLERLSSPQQALQHYRAAEQVFQRRLAALQRVSRDVDDSAWVRDLLRGLAETAIARPGAAGTAASAVVEPAAITSPPGWDGALSREDWLEWLAAEDVHRVLLEWRELSGMDAWLDGLQPRLEAYEQVAVERRRRAAAAGEIIHRQDLRGRRETLAAEVDGLAARLNEVKAGSAIFNDSWMGQLATPEEQRVLGEIRAMQATLARIPPGERAAWAPRIQRLRGSVFWQIADTQSSRVRNLEKALRENRETLAAVDARIARLAAAETSFANGVQADFTRFAGRAELIRVQLAEARASREALLGEALGRALRREARVLEGYLLTARIAVARATDQLASRDGLDDPGDGS